MKFLTNLIFFLIISILAFWSASAAFSSSQEITPLDLNTTAPFSAAEVTANQKNLKVVGLNDDYPLMFINRNGMPDGLAVNLLREFSESFGYTVQFELLNTEQLRLISADSYDVIYSGNRISAPELTRLTEPFYIHSYTLFVEQSAAEKIDFLSLFLEDSGKLSIGYRSNDNLDKFLENKSTRNSLMPMPNHDSALEGLLEDQYDAAFMPKEIGLLLLSERNALEIQALETTLYLEENSFIVSASDILLQFELNNFIQSLKKSGRLQTLVKTWISIPESNSEESNLLSLFNYFFLISAAATFAFSYRSYHLERDVEKQAAELNQLNYANEELWTALINEERYKNEYYINLSHELRTPLSLILNAVNAAERSVLTQSSTLSADKFSKYTGIAKNNSMRLLRVINNLIDANHLENKDYTLDLKRVDLVLELNELIKWINEVLDPKALDIHLSTSLKSLEAIVDPYELDRIILNLISNAFKFNDQKPCIQLKLSSGNESLFIDFEDNSLGIPKDSVQRAFQKFHQLESEFSVKSEGAGFGLYLSKQLIELHGGTLSPIYASGTSGMHYRLQLPLTMSEEYHKPSSGKSLFYDRGRLVRLELSEIKTQDLSKN
ncbi:ATP-binding protein [Acidaminobacter hydrogenoformans]|uniref:histidine kinase n=1 Tax=Acidaminobacter hydrogenoformans DSM 2784 TaxID=1120920 RepID=A0A1G5RSP7_9FIRM|nr:ATP-binding protein [Acidaminobacter hydrogenoformans]SCZ77114.1 Signal transduction histidine kinase [Acidaminobacter hydrogenoformans DSM 2784]